MPDNQILFVCTANICRSPAAEAIARSRFGEAQFTFRSAGFLEVGRPIEPDMAKALDRIGVVAGPHRSSVVDAELVESSALILTMEARHVQNIVIEHEAAFAKVLPLREAAEIIDARRPHGIEQLLAALGTRDPMRYLDRRWDVDDPYKRRKKHYNQSVVEISGLVDTVMRALR